MAVVSVTNIRVLNNPCPLTDPFLFEIHFEAQQPLQQDVEWRVVYVGSGEHHSAAVQHRTSSSSSNGSSAQANGGSSTCIANKRSSNGAGDYVLDSVLLGPIECGALAFEFAVDAPDFTKMDRGSVEGMQAVLVCGFYKEQEFVRIGYYLNNAYSDPALRENPPEEPQYDRLVRCIVDSPRVTKFPITWDESSQEEISVPPPVANSNSTEHACVPSDELPTIDPSESSEKSIVSKTQTPVGQPKSEASSRTVTGGDIDESVN